jgi:hypothetical protein
VPTVAGAAFTRASPGSPARAADCYGAPPWPRRRAGLRRACFGQSLPVGETTAGPGSNGCRTGSFRCGVLTITARFTDTATRRVVLLPALSTQAANSARGASLARRFCLVRWPRDRPPIDQPRQVAARSACHIAPCSVAAGSVLDWAPDSPLSIAAVMHHGETQQNCLARRVHNRGRGRSRRPFPRSMLTSPARPTWWHSGAIQPMWPAPGSASGI